MQTSTGMLLAATKKPLCSHSRDVLSGATPIPVGELWRSYPRACGDLVRPVRIAACATITQFRSLVIGACWCNVNALLVIYAFAAVASSEISMFSSLATWAFLRACLASAERRGCKMRLSSSSGRLSSSSSIP